jgi:microcompartment protein CcmL/EutN
VGDGLVAAHIIARVHSEVEGILPTQPEVNGGGGRGGRDAEITSTRS